MTKILFSFLLCVVLFTAKAQKEDSLKVNKDSVFNYTQDYILRKLVPVLPLGWAFKAKNNQFIIYRIDSVHIADKTIFNIPKNKKLSDDTIIIYGLKTQSKIIYRYENRWTTEQNMKANSNNTPIFIQLSKLPEKYNITKLADKSKSSRENTVYTGKTEEEKDLINLFEKERLELRKKLIQKPIYHTEKYSLFLISTTGGNDSNFSVYPEIASNELYSILTLFFELTEKSY